MVDVVFDLDGPDRSFAYSATVLNIYGQPLAVSETFRS